MKTPEVAQLLLKNYFEENFGTVEKINIQEKYCFIIFDDDESAKAALKEPTHEFTGYKIKIKPKTNLKIKPNSENFLGETSKQFYLLKTESVFRKFIEENRTS